MGHGAAHRFHNAHHLMAHRDTGNGPGNAAMLDVQIAGADAGQRHLHNGVPLVQQYWLRLFQQCKFSLFNVCVSLHFLILPFISVD